MVFWVLGVVKIVELFFMRNVFFVLRLLIV